MQSLKAPGTPSQVNSLINPSLILNTKSPSHYSVGVLRHCQPWLSLPSPLGLLPTPPVAQDPMPGPGAVSPSPSQSLPQSQQVPMALPHPQGGARCLGLGLPPGWWDGLGCQALPGWGSQSSWCPRSPSPHHTPDVCAFMFLLSKKKKKKKGFMKLGYIRGCGVWSLQLELLHLPEWDLIFLPQKKEIIKKIRFSYKSSRNKRSQKTICFSQPQIRPAIGD